MPVPAETSTTRLYVMRAMYLMNFALLGKGVWLDIFNHVGPWDPMIGVAYSFWAALSTLSVLGLRYPLRMLPVLLLQMAYKIIWLLVVARPQWSVLQSTEIFKAMSIGVVLDLIVIPWPYVFANYVREPGDRWRPAPARRA